MSVDKAKQHLKKWQMDTKIMEFEVSSATVEEVAEALGCEAKRIAKTLSFNLKGTPILIVTAGDAKVDNVKYKNTLRPRQRCLNSIRFMRQ